MRRFESLKRIIVLQLSLIGLVFMTIGYYIVWFNCYYEVIAWRLKYTFKGYLLLIALYFMLLLFFCYTYGGTKIGYWKTGDVILSQIFSAAIVNVITYIQISLMSLKMVAMMPLVVLFLFQIIVAGGWSWVCQKVYQKVFPPRACC